MCSFVSEPCVQARLRNTDAAFGDTLLKQPLHVSLTGAILALSSGLISDIRCINIKGKIDARNQGPDAVTNLCIVPLR
jgi:hypothetical protein